MNNHIIVTIPAYNGASSIATAIRSVQAQTRKDFELYVIDNCSEDNTTAIVQEFAELDPRIHLERNEANVGLMGNFNRCLQFTLKKNADFFLLLCCDDVIYPSYLQEKAAVMESDPTVVMVCNATDIINSRGKRIMVRRNLPDGVMNGWKCVQKSLYRGNIFGEPSGVLLRVDAVRQAGLFDECFFYSLDWEYYSRVAMYGNVAYIGQPLNAFRVSGYSASSKILQDMKRLREEHALIMKTLYARLGIQETFLRRVISSILFLGKTWVKKVIFRLFAGQAH